MRKAVFMIATVVVLLVVWLVVGWFFQDPSERFGR
jgi:hypothetical protein